MSKENLEFRLTNISSSYDPEHDYFSLEAEMKPSLYENLFILSSKILSYKDDILINSSDGTLMLFENKDDVCSIFDGISENGNSNPNKFDVIYRIFNLIEKNTLNLKLPGPPELSRKGGSFIVHQPERNIIGLNKWKFGSISIESIVIRKIESSFEINFNLENKDFLSSIPIIEVKGDNWSQKSEPILPENSKFQILMNIYEEIDSSDIDFNFMFFEGRKPEKLSDQEIPDPDIEENDKNDDTYSEDVSEIVIGKTYDVCAYHKKSLTQVMQYQNKKTDESLNIEKLWRNGNFKITIQNDNEKDYLQSCLGENGEQFDHENFEKIEVIDHFDEQSEDFVFYSDDAKEKRLQDEFDKLNETRDELLSKEEFLEDKGFKYLYSCFYIDGGVIANEIEEETIEDDDKEADTSTNVEAVKDNKSFSNETNFFKHNVMLVSIAKSLTENKKIYDAARYAWDAKKERAENMDYVIAHQRGKIVGVFEPEKWLYADDKEFSEFPKADPKRIGFKGKVADSEILLEYLNKDIPSEFRPKGASNPVRYIELEKSNTKTKKKNKKSKVSPQDVKKSDVKEFGWWNIHKGYDENDIDQYVCEFYEIKDDLDENGEEIVDEDGYSSTQKDDGWGNLYNPKITMEMVMSIETFLQKYIDEYDGGFGETDMGRALKEWIAHYTSHVQHDPPWDYPDRNYKMWG